jgi:hypothetical protein
MARNQPVHLASHLVMPGIRQTFKGVTAASLSILAVIL